MGRPPLPLGTMGEIRCYRLANGRVRATANFRDYDGQTRRVERVAKSEAQARARLKEACRDRGRNNAVSDISPDTTVRAVAEVWLADIHAAVLVGERSPGTEVLYRERLTKFILPALGALRLRELTISRVDKVLGQISTKHGAANARTTRTVLSGVLGLAARHDAVRGNLVRDAGPIREQRKQADSLSVEELRDLRARVASDEVANAQDLVDIVDVVVATGLRIGEVLALRWSALELESRTLEVRATLMAVDGQGVVLREQPKTKAGFRIVELPGWCVRMLKRRAKVSLKNVDDLVFPSVRGKRRQPNNTIRDLRGAFDRAGYPAVTAHTLRRSVATVMDEAGLSARAAADQLGHARVSMTSDRYFGRRTRATGAAGVLEVLAFADESEDEGSDE